MKLNMMVVITMCEPRFACSQAGSQPQAAPNRAPLMIATGTSRANGSASR